LNFARGSAIQEGWVWEALLRKKGVLQIEASAHGLAFIASLSDLARSVN